MGRVKIDWDMVFCNSSPDCEVGIYHGSSLWRPQATAMRAAPATAKRMRADKEGITRVSSGGEQRRGAQSPRLRLESLYSKLERRVGELRPAERSPVTRAAAKAAADPVQDAHSAAHNVHNFNQEDGQGEHVACKYCPKSSSVLVRRKKNHEQGHGDCKRVAVPAANKNDDKEPAPPEEIFEVLREIPSLDRADVLRAYSMLIRDDRLFRSLTALPKDMRNDWLLMEIGNQ